MSRGLRVTLRVVVSVLAVLALLLVAASAYLTWTIHRSFPQLSGTIDVPGLSAPVDVYRDQYGVPQVYASTSADLFFAQGYVSAQDRFWEMDFRRHVTAGRLSELFGADQVQTDEFLRISGWRRVAEQEYPLLAPATKLMLDSYAKGVNAYLATHSGPALSFEYAVLGLRVSNYKPEPWTPIDSLAWLKAMAWDLKGNYDEEIRRAIAAAEVGTGPAEELFPVYPYQRNSPIVDQGALVNGVYDQSSNFTTPYLSGPGPLGGPKLPVVPIASVAALRQANTALHLLDAVLGPENPGVGSNSWVVSGRFTTTGKPFLANDPHLGPVMPSIWYQMGLHCRALSSACPYDVSGFTFSGLPGVVIGHNQSIAWGFTNLGPDVTDLVLEQVAGESYVVDGRAVPFTEHTETIKVAGGADVKLTVRETKDGPLISDAGTDEIKQLGEQAPVPAGSPDRGSGYAVALHWTALQPTATADAIELLDRATNWQQFRLAARSFAVPSQNLIYADTSGNIGYQSPGLIPVRQGYDGRYPAAGWDSQQKWIGYVPFDALPSVENPKDGYIVTANNAVTYPTYPYHLTSDWTYGTRSQRIKTLLQQDFAKGKVSADQLRAIELDSWNGNAAVLAPALLAVQTSGETAQAQALLKGWDYTQPADSAAAAFFNATYAHLLDLLFAGVYTGDLRPDGHDRWFEVIRNLLANPSDYWWTRAERKLGVTHPSDVLAKAMSDATAELNSKLGSDPANWQWGALHTLTVQNASFGTSGIGVIEWLFNAPAVRLPSGSDSIDATGWSAYAGYQDDEVPSMRMVVDLSDLDASTWINLTGASGHTWNSNYVDQLPLWASGRTTPFPFTASAVQAAAVHHLVLQPTAAAPA